MDTSLVWWVHRSGMAGVRSVCLLIGMGHERSGTPWSHRFLMDCSRISNELQVYMFLASKLDVYFEIDVQAMRADGHLEQLGKLALVCDDSCKRVARNGECCVVSFGHREDGGVGFGHRMESCLTWRLVKRFSAMSLEMCLKNSDLGAETTPTSPKTCISTR